MISELTDATFDADVMQGGSPSVILFTSGWCALCEDMLPMMEAAAARHADAARFYACNVDENRALRIKFAVAALPTVAYVRDGNVAVLFDGVTTQDALEERIAYMLAGGKAPNERPLR